MKHLKGKNKICFYLKLDSESLVWLRSLTGVARPFDGVARPFAEEARLLDEAERPLAERLFAGRLRPLAVAVAAVRPFAVAVRPLAEAGRPFAGAVAAATLRGAMMPDDLGWRFVVKIDESDDVWRDCGN